LLALIALILIGIAGRTVVMNSETLQDRIVERAALSRMASVVDNYGGEKMDIVFCGTASPMGQAPASGGAQSCIAVFAGDKFFIIDTGASSADMASKLGLPMGRLDAVLLTHFHSDHISALGDMHLASWVRGRRGKLPVYGGPGIEQVVGGFNMAYGQDFTYRTDHHGEDYVPSKHAGMVAQLIRSDGVIYDGDGLTITAITVSHPPIEPAMAFRIDYGGRSVLISGDTVKDNNLIKAAKNVDVLIHEVLQQELVDITVSGLRRSNQGKLGKILDDTLDYHTTPVEAAESANAANAELLVFYHYAPVPQNALMRSYFLRGVHDIRPQGALLATEGTHITLPVNSDIIDQNE
jgi:ribonuclease Z